MSTKKSIVYAVVALLVFQAFNGLSGLLGGFMLIKDPTGVSLHMKMEWLQGTPFSTFLIPGIILFLLNGIGNVIGFWISFKKKANAGSIGAVFGAIMMIWITTQVILIGYKDFLQPLYFSTGLFQMILGLISRGKIK
jgi:hypothetical protein